MPSRRLGAELPACRQAGRRGRAMMPAGSQASCQDPGMPCGASRYLWCLVAPRGALPSPTKSLLSPARHACGAGACRPPVPCPAAQAQPATVPTSVGCTNYTATITAYISPPRTRQSYSEGSICRTTGIKTILGARQRGTRSSVPRADDKRRHHLLEGTEYQRPQESRPRPHLPSKEEALTAVVAEGVPQAAAGRRRGTRHGARVAAPKFIII